MSKELTLKNTLKKGSSGDKVKAVQEWLSLSGFHVAIDRQFGPATDRAVREFQKKHRLKIDGKVGKKTFSALTRPMARALAPLKGNYKSLGRAVVDVAKQHLGEHPREVGGQNMGPWVRLYTGGYEGSEWPWCAGFVSHILAQAAEAAGADMPIRGSVSCDTLANRAMNNKIFLSEAKAKKGGLLKGGYLFLSRRTPGDWTHTGLVLSEGEGFFNTIEGNTNDEGSREGYEVCQRIRGFKNKDFIMI